MRGRSLKLRGNISPAYWALFVMLIILNFVLLFISLGYLTFRSQELLEAFVWSHLVVVAGIVLYDIYLRKINGYEKWILYR